MGELTLHCFFSGESDGLHSAQAWSALLLTIFDT